MADRASSEGREKGDVWVANLSASLLAGVQPDRLPELGKLSTDGFLQRFLPIILKAPGPDEDRWPNEHADRQWRAVIDRLRALDRRADFGDEDFVLSPEAKAERRELHDFVRVMSKATDPAAAFGAFCGKLEGVKSPSTWMNAAKSVC